MFNTDESLLNTVKDCKTTVVIIDLIHYSNASKHKKNFAEVYLNRVYQYLANYHTYYTSIYKHGMYKRIFVETSEESLTSIINTTQEIEYLLLNITHTAQALVVNLGRYKEYFYLNKLLQKYCSNNNIKLKFMSVKHYSNYSVDNYNYDSKNIFSGVQKIKKNADYLSNLM